MSKNLENDLMKPALACGLAIVLPYALKTFVDGKYQNPLKPILPMNFGEFSSFVPCAAGAASLAYGALRRNTSAFVFGITSLVIGIINGISTTQGARASRPVGQVIRPQMARLPQCSSMTALQQKRMGHGLQSLRQSGIGKVQTGRSEFRAAKPIDNRIIRA